MSVLRVGADLTCAWRQVGFWTRSGLALAETVGADGNNRSFGLQWLDLRRFAFMLGRIG
jgi:hypothetical protein